MQPYEQSFRDMYIKANKPDLMKNLVHNYALGAFKMVYVFNFAIPEMKVAFIFSSLPISEQKNTYKAAEDCGWQIYDVTLPCHIIGPTSQQFYGPTSQQFYIDKIDNLIKRVYREQSITDKINTWKNLKV